MFLINCDKIIFGLVNYFIDLSWNFYQCPLSDNSINKANFNLQKFICVVPGIVLIYSLKRSGLFSQMAHTKFV